MGTCRRSDCPREAPAVRVEHRKRPEIDRVVRQRPTGHLHQTHEVCPSMAWHHALGIAGRSRRVVQRDRLPLVNRPDALERRVAAGQQGLVVDHADGCRVGTHGIVDVDQQRGVLETLDGSSSQCCELAVHEEDLGFSMAQDEGHAFGVKPTVDGIEHRACKRHSEMRFQHGRSIGRNDRDGVAPLHATPSQSGGHPIATVARLRPRLAQPAMDDRNAIGVDIGTAIKKSERSQRYMVGGRAIKSARIGSCTHRGCLRCAGAVRRWWSEGGVNCVW